MNNRSLQTAVSGLALALAYFITGRLGLMLPAHGSHITLIWLPTGIAVAALLRWGLGCWPGVALGATLVNFTTGIPLPTALGIAVGNTTGPVLAAWLLRRMGLHPAFDRRRDILLLSVAAVLGMVVSASFGVAMLSLTGALAGSRPAAWLTWWAGDTMGVIAAAPLLLSFTRGEWRTITSRLSEFIAWVCLTGTAALGIFFLSTDPHNQLWAPSFLTLPLVAWAALRFGTIGTSLAIILISGAAGSATATGHGPFSRGNPSENAVMVWLFMATCAALGWLITALQAGRLKAVALQNTSTEFANTLIDSMQDGFTLMDAHGVQVDVNRAFCEMTGFTRGELIGLPPPHPYWPPEHHGRIQAALAETLAGRRGNFELTFMRRNGGRFPVMLSASAIENEAGQPVNYVATVKDITERKKAEEALLSERSRLRTVLDVLPISIYVKDTQSRFLVVNAACAEALGAASWGGMLGRTDADYFPPAIAATFREDELRVLAGEPVLNLEEPSVAPDGTPRTELTTKVPLRDAEGNITGLVGVSRNITAQKRAEEALQLAGQRLRLHFDQTPMAVIEWDLQFRVTEWNPAAMTIFGYSRGEALGQHASFIVPEKVRPHVDQVWRVLMEKSGGEKSTNENVRRDGTGILCEWYNTPLVDGRGTVVGVASVVVDITERRQAQQLLAWEKNAMELISSPASLGDVLEGLMYGLEKQAPDSLCSILLLDPDGLHLRHGAAPSLPEAYTRAIDGASIGPKAGSCGTAAYTDRQVIVTDIASDPLWADYRELAAPHGLRACWSTPIRGSKRKILGTFAIYYREPRQPVPAEIELIERATHIIRIAIERKQAEQSLRDSEQKFRTLFENAGDAIFLMQGELFTDCNVRTLEMFGCQARNQIVGHPPYEFSPPLQPNGRDSRECAIEKITAAFKGRPQNFEWMHTKLDGTPFPAEVTLNTVFLGGQVMLQAIVRDISARKRAEEEIRTLNSDLENRVRERTAELQAANRELEAFSYSVSHDLRTPLRAVDGFSRLVVKRYGDKFDGEGLRMLGLIRGGAQRMGRLIDDLLAFSRLGRQPLDHALIDMQPLARSVFDELAALDPARRLRLDLRPLPPARGTQAMIRQVWVNLLSNAIKFTQHREVGEIEIGARRSGDGGEWIYYVRDNGAGFDMRHVARLFGVFQRLHAMEEFEGTGVGLALVQRIVQRHGGRVWAEGETDRGATLSFTLSTPHP
jgi:PAS domain S-box-containing protein